MNDAQRQVLERAWLGGIEWKSDEVRELIATGYLVWDEKEKVFKPTPRGFRALGFRYVKGDAAGEGHWER